MRTATAALSIVVGAALWFVPASASAAGCKRGSEGFERAQFGVDLGLSLGGGATAAVGRFAILQRRGRDWDLAIDRGVPENGSEASRIASDVLLWSSFAGAAAWGIYATVHCNRRYTLRRTVATPLLEVVWPFLWTYGLGEITKSFSGRPRPYTRGEEGFMDERDDYRSFWSGHTANSATMVSVTVGSALRFAKGRAGTRGGRALISAGSGLVYGLTTGVTRVVAARHHWSDILVGGFIGTGIGLLPIATEAIGRHGEGEIAIGPWLGGAGGQVGGRF
ncbi:MAG: phosphatase PAP2 family protein [Myxococcota bacterium]